jgi:hypothetical protein
MKGISEPPRRGTAGVRLDGRTNNPRCDVLSRIDRACVCPDTAYATVRLCDPSYSALCLADGGFKSLPEIGLNPTSSCYSGTIYPSYSAVIPFEFPKPNSKARSKGADSLYQDEAKLRIEEKGYFDVTNLDKDSRGIWRGSARLEDGRTVDVTLDLEGNIYSVPTRLQIRIKPPPPDR